MELAGHKLATPNENLIDKIWTDAPPQPSGKITVLGLEHAGKSLEDKLSILRKELKDKSCWGCVISFLDEVAWLFNLRGADISFNPVFLSYALVTSDEAFLYVDSSKVSTEVYILIIILGKKPFG